MQLKTQRHRLAAAPAERAVLAAPAQPSAPDARARLVQAARADFQFIWRCLRRFGVQPEPCVDDAAQRVFEIAVARIDVILPGHERAFLFKTAVWVARDFQRKRARQREHVDAAAADAAPDAAGDPESLLDERRWRERLDELLDGLPSEQRTVLVLYELEGLQLNEIAALLEIPQGTVASRLRRARETFLDRARRLRVESELIRVKP